jgi:hypothetical protein
MVEAQEHRAARPAVAGLRGGNVAYHADVGGVFVVQGRRVGGPADDTEGQEITKKLYAFPRRRGRPDAEDRAAEASTGGGDRRARRAASPARSAGEGRQGRPQVDGTAGDPRPVDDELVVDPPDLWVRLARARWLRLVALVACGAGATSVLLLVLFLVAWLPGAPSDLVIDTSEASESSESRPSLEPADLLVIVSPREKRRPRKGTAKVRQDDARFVVEGPGGGLDPVGEHRGVLSISSPSAGEVPDAPVDDSPVLETPPIPPAPAVATRTDRRAVTMAAGAEASRCYRETFRDRPVVAPQGVARFRVLLAAGGYTDGVTVAAAPPGLTPPDFLACLSSALRRRSFSGFTSPTEVQAAVTLDRGLLR